MLLNAHKSQAVLFETVCYTFPNSYSPNLQQSQMILPATQVCKITANGRGKFRNAIQPLLLIEAT